MSEENEKRKIIERLQEELIHKREIPSERVGNSINKGIHGGLNEGYQPTRNIVGLPPGADEPDSNEGDE